MFAEDIITFKEFLVHGINSFQPHYWKKLRSIQIFTIYLKYLHKNYSRERDVDTNINITELKALFGLLYIPGAIKMDNANLADLFKDTLLVPPIFRLVTPEKRFYLLLKSRRGRRCVR